MPNLNSLHACNPSFAIFSQEESDYYIDLVVGRGEDVVKRLRRTIALSPNKPTYQLLSGHIGSGKTTELQRLKAELEQQGFVVIFCAADEYLQIDDLSLTELWLVILNLILKQLENKSNSLPLAYLPNAIAEIEQWLKMPPSMGVSTYASRIQKILQALQSSTQYRRQLHHYLDPRLKNSLLASGEEVSALEVDRLKQFGKKGLVILVDNLDRLSLERVEVIFGEGGKYLKQFQCHTIYTLPIQAIFHADEQLQHNFQQSLKGNAPIVLPNLTLKDRQGMTNPESLNVLRQVVLARMLTKTSPERGLEQVNDVFDNLETLDLLCLSSQGHLPYLLFLLSGCLQSQEPPIHLETLSQVLQTDYSTRLSTISDRDRQSLQKCLASPHQLTSDTLNLCRRLLLFENHDAQGYWFSSPFVSLP
ncbi:MAG: hypothetical protein DCF19_12525 [Pseudanabaena frigida]|uniref:Orc1-like AAA ATPase domain-containing protein n=1 Tax=Pseudanabaena frigida TaxID=945775 RepID=A0A2W4W6J6_9CYAN|nr:MAG: hypothetical protein DCF19_12525 [Pseudanabaena frigida]